jgi:hypothetical protein
MSIGLVFLIALIVAPVTTASIIFNGVCYSAKATWAVKKMVL